MIQNPTVKKVELIYKPRAAKSIERVVDWIEGQNTDGSGARWFDRLDSKLISLANSKAKFALCKHPSLAKFNYHCYAYKDWVVAFKTTNKKFEVCRFIYGARLG